MAKTKGGERARRQARQAKRARAEEQAKFQQPVASAASGKKATQANLAKPDKKEEKKAKGGKPGLTKRARNYLVDVKAEMRRVVWPSKRELRNYSIAVICLLIVFGVVVWLVDTGIVAALVGYVGLRG